MSREGLMSFAGTPRSQGARLVSCALSLVLLVARTTPAQVVYPRGDADCSGQLSAVDLIAAVHGGGSASVCGNDDCDRDGVVTSADLACTVDCLFGTCTTPPNAPRVTGVVPDSAPSIVPLSVVRITGANLGSSERLKRVTIGDADAQIVGTPSPNTFLVLVPSIDPGTTDVVVHDGDLAGFPFPISVAVPVPIGAPDTFDGSLDVLHQVLVGLGSLDLEQVYGEDADAVRGALAHLRSTLGIARAGLAADPTFTPQARAQLDAAFESSGLPEQLRQLLADINTIRSGGGADGADGGGAQIDPSVLIFLATAAATTLAAIAALTGAAPLLVPITLITTALVSIGALLGLNATGLTEPPRIIFAEFHDRTGEFAFRAVEGGQVIITGERLLLTNLVMRTARAETVLEPEASDAGSLQFRIPRGVYGVCGSAVFFLRRTIPPFAESNQLRRAVLPELTQINRSDAVPDDPLVLETRGVAGCDPIARFRGSKREASAPTDYYSPTQTRVTVPALLPGEYEVSLKVGSEESESRPLRILNFVSGLKVECTAADLLVQPGNPFETTCVADPQPPGVKVPAAFLNFRWTSSDTGTASVFDLNPVEGKGQAKVTVVAPGTTNITATLPTLDVTSNAFTITVRDTTAPSVTLAAPSTADPDASISVSVSAGDNVFVTRLVLHATGDTSSGDQEFPCMQLEKTCANSFTVGLKATGTVTLVADAFDESGNKGTSNAVTVAINPPPADTTAPQVMITSPANGGNVNVGETVSVSVHASDNQPGDTGVQRVVIDVSGDALVGGAHSEVALPAAVPDTTQMASFTVKSAADLANVTNKSIVITAQAFDATGNTASQTATVSVLGTLDTCDGGIQAAPTSGHIEDPFTITVAIAGPAAGRVAKVTSINPGGSYDLTKQGDVYTVTLFFRGQGSFTLSFTALDADGHALCSGSIGLTSLGPNG